MSPYKSLLAAFAVLALTAGCTSIEQLQATPPLPQLNETPDTIPSLETIPSDSATTPETNLVSEGNPSPDSAPVSAIPSGTSASYSSSATNAVIDGEGASSKNIRSGPGTKYSVEHIAYPGDRLQILDSAQDSGGYTWYKVWFPKSGAQGWIAAQLIEIDSSSRASKPQSSVGESLTSKPQSSAGETSVKSDYDCPDFATQAEAQEYLLSGDTYRLDADDDGVACESLP